MRIALLTMNMMKTMTTMMMMMVWWAGVIWRAVHKKEKQGRMHHKAEQPHCAHCNALCIYIAQKSSNPVCTEYCTLYVQCTMCILCIIKPRNPTTVHIAMHFV